MEDISIEKHSAAVGSVATHWALFEFLLDITVWSATKLEPRIGACLTAQISGHARKLDAVIGLTRTSGADMSPRTVFAILLIAFAVASACAGLTTARQLHDQASVARMTSRG
jgi:hypothetical protein